VQSAEQPAGGINRTYNKNFTLGILLLVFGDAHSIQPLKVDIHNTLKSFI
jgi:hypothetical protein